MSVMIIALSVVTGYRNEIRAKVIGFGSHIQINAYSEGEPINTRNTSFYPSIKEEEGIEHIQVYAMKAGIIQNQGDTVYRNNSSDFKIDRDILGVMCKGVGSDFKWDFIVEKIIEGTHPNITSANASNEILISKYISDKLKLDVGETLDMYFPKGKTSPKRIFTIVGIYESGFEEFDKNLVFLDIRFIQKINDWGVRTSLKMRETCKNGRFALEASCFGGNKNYRFDFGYGYQVPVNGDGHNSVIPFCPFEDTVIQVIAADFTHVAPGTGEEPKPLFLPDTAWLHITTTVKNDSFSSCACPYEGDFFINSTTSDDGLTNTFELPHLTITTQLTTSGGSSNYYAGGFEIYVSDWENIENDLNKVNHATGAIGHSSYRVQSIKDLKSDIFGWLDMLDMNVWIILTLTIFVAVINMSSALLVLILERTNMIGILKAMGSVNWSIRKIFLYNAVYLIGRGMFWGNVIGLGLCFLQQQFSLVSLSQETYYVSTVPVSINPVYILLLNAGTIVLCTLALIIPSYIVTRISPVKAIKFN